MTVTIEDLRSLDLFEGVVDECLAQWAAAAEERHLEPGDSLVEFDDLQVPFSMLLEGRLDGYFLIEGRAELDHRHVAPTWLGAILALTDAPAMAAIRAAEPSRVASIEPLRFRRLLADTPEAFPRVMSVFRPVLARIEGAALQREKLAALGQMSAGLAHELNNPAAAAKRTAAMLADALALLDGAIGEFVESGVERADAEVFVRLKREAVARAQAAPARDGLAAADAEDEIGEWLEAHAVPDAWQLAEPLAAARLDCAWLDELAGAAGPVLPTAVRWVATSLSARSLSDDLRESTDRMSGLVQAIKAYTYMDQADLQEVDVHDGIEATLTMLHHKLKHTQIEVRRAFDPALPRVCVYGSELNQVWTNLLDNAIDSLGDAGTITITTAPWHENGVEVTIADDGPGIPEDAQRRVFEPFFTTKAVGSGTGLGLDTAMRIVRERHDGDLRLRSRPGETAFAVRLPRSPSKRG
jgi:signal transduction histidine kinase